jgi:GMP synthase PP-ATPase subunit
MRECLSRGRLWPARVLGEVTAEKIELVRKAPSTIEAV